MWIIKFLVHCKVYVTYVDFSIVIMTYSNVIKLIYELSEVIIYISYMKKSLLPQNLQIRYFTFLYNN